LPRFFACAKVVEITWLRDYLETIIEIRRNKVGERQTIETLIDEEALLFAKCLRNEKKD
jgi:hypothetical protein